MIRGDEMSYRITCTQDGVVQYPMHTHKEFEIMLYLEGEGYMRTELGNFGFKRGSIIIVPPNVRHGSVSEKGFKNISLSGEFRGYLNFDYVVCLGDNEAGDGTTLSKLIYENRYAAPSYLNALCLAYISFLLQRFEIKNQIYKSIGEIISEISENAFDSQIELSRILTRSGYSEDYIRACFKQITGKTPGEFLTDIRIKHACFLIDIYKGECPLSKIGEQCGYLDYVYFSKRFKAVMGMSPREYKDK
jgi:AraC-like DNA-binding protein